MQSTQSERGEQVKIIGKILFALIVLPIMVLYDLTKKV